MKKSVCTGKRVATLFLIFLSACSCPCREWSLFEVKTCCETFNSGRLILPAEESFCSLETILTRDATGIFLYVDTHVLCFPENRATPEHLMIECTIGNGAPYSCQTTRLQGGQRLLFDEECTLAIVNALLAGNSVTLRIGQFHTELIPEGFEKLWCELMNLRIE